MLLTKRILIFYTVISFLIYFITLALGVQQEDYGSDLLTMTAPNIAEGAMMVFQEADNMEPYTDGGAMSYTYSEYLNWLAGQGDFSEVSSDLRNMFDMGLTPTNFSLPYLDKNKLTAYFNEYLNDQVEAFNSTRQLGKISNLTGKVENISLVTKEFSSDHSIFGNSSSFYTNDNGEEKIYDYDYYLDYTVTFTVTADISTSIKIFGHSLDTQPYEYTFTLNYNLFN